MFLHYLKIAWRNLLKYKTQSIINVLGLTIGIVFFAYGYQWYQFETTYDSFYPNSGLIYRLYAVHKSSGKPYGGGEMPYVAVNELQQTFPEIARSAVLFSRYSSSMTYDTKYLGYPDFEFVDERFFLMFPPKVLAGTLNERSMGNSDDLIVTESFARKHFGDPNEAVGKTLVSGYNISYTIRAVIADPRVNSLFRSEGYIPDTFVKQHSDRADELVQWHEFTDARIYFELHPQTNVVQLSRKLETFAVDRGYNYDMLIKMVPLSSVRYTVSAYDSESMFDIKYIRTFIFAGILLLFAVFFNYLNLLIRNLRIRSREINLRRVTGASGCKIFLHFFTEITCIMVIAGLLAFSLSELIQGIFEREFSTVVAIEHVFLILLFTILLVSLLLYLSVYLFLFRFVRKMSFRQFVPKRHNSFFGNGSLILQLVIGVSFIMCSFVFWRQVHFLQTSDWGFNKENLLQLKTEVRERPALLKAIRELPMVTDIIESDYFYILSDPEDMGPLGVDGVMWENKPAADNPMFESFSVDTNFISSMGLSILEGRNFTAGDFTRRNEADKVVINEAAQRAMGLVNPIGEKISVPARWFNDLGRGKDEFEIIGVVKDFHTLPLQYAIPPLIIKGERLNAEGYMNYIRVAPGTEREAEKAINQLIPRFFPDKEGSKLVTSMKEILEDLSKTERDLLHLFTTVALLCILISVFGIYSVSQDETQRRRKEIAIRKTSGAKTNEIIGLFIKEYLSITLAACIIGLPLSTLFMQHWLETFTNHISITGWMFLLVILFTVIIVLITVYGQITRVARENPAEVVKSE